MRVALVPERAKGWDVGVEQTLFSGMAIVDVTYFESTLEKEIFTSFGPPPLFLSTPANSNSDSDRIGWEARLRFHPTSDIDVVGSLTNLDATEPAGIEVRRPKNQAALDAGWRIGGGALKFDLGVTYNGEQVDTDFHARPSILRLAARSVPAKSSEALSVTRRIWAAVLAMCVSYCFQV